MCKKYYNYINLSLSTVKKFYAMLHQKYYGTAILILLSLIMEVCKFLLKKSKTKFTCKQTNVTPQRKYLFWLKCDMLFNPDDDFVGFRSLCALGIYGMDH